MQLLYSLVLAFCLMTLFGASKGYAQFTLGMVQSSIQEGMDQSEVAVVLGSPNMVTQDAKGNETWIYDKISTTVTDSSRSQGRKEGAAGGVGAGISIGGALLGFGRGTSQSNFEKSQSGTTTRSSKTLTVIIKFDENKLVSKVRFNQSAF